MANIGYYTSLQLHSFAISANRYFYVVRDPANVAIWQFIVLENRKIGKSQNRMSTRRDRHTPKIWKAPLSNILYPRRICPDRERSQIVIDFIYIYLNIYRAIKHRPHIKYWLVKISVSTSVTIFTRVVSFGISYFIELLNSRWM